MIAAVIVKESARFPGKHMRLLNGDTLIGRVTKSLQRSSSFDEVVLWSKDPKVYAEKVRVIVDESEGTAINSILSLVESYGEVFVVAGDMPMISPDFVADMVRRYRGIPIFPVHLDGETEPLHGIYNSSMIDEMKTYISSGGKSLKKLLDLLVFERVPIDEDHEKCFTNINYEEDLNSLIHGE